MSEWQPLSMDEPPPRGVFFYVWGPSLPEPTLGIFRNNSVYTLDAYLNLLARGACSIPPLTHWATAMQEPPPVIEAMRTLKEAGKENT